MKNRRPDIYEMLDTSTLQDKIDLRDYLDTQIKEQEQQPEQSYLEEQYLVSSIILVWYSYEKPPSA